jgi:hypothetical protein
MSRAWHVARMRSGCVRRHKGSSEWSKRSAWTEWSAEKFRWLQQVSFYQECGSEFITGCYQSNADLGGIWGLLRSRLRPEFKNANAGVCLEDVLPLAGSDRWGGVVHASHTLYIVQ